MSRSEIIEKLKEVLAMVTGEEAGESITEDARLIEDIGLNSIGLLYIVVGVEEIFSIRFENVGVGDFVTVGDVVNYIESKTQA